MQLADEFDRLIDTLESRGLPYAVAGGLAVAVWGAPRATTDIDILVPSADVPAVVAAVADIGFTLGALPMRFRDGVEVHRLTKIADGDALTLDILVADGFLADVWRDRVRVAHGVREISVVSRDGLIRMKLSAGRGQDIVDVEKLREGDR